MKSKIQPVIIILGIISMGVAIRYMLQVKTMILPSWFLLLFYLSITICVSFVLGFLLKKIMKSKWHTLTFASVLLIIFCSIFFVNQYRPTYKIVIPESYSGEIKLLVSNEKENDFVVNNYGIGYINKVTFDKGFHPEIIKGDKDITKQVKEYSKGALATTEGDVYSYEYLSFSIPAKTGNVEDIGFEELIKTKAIDTSRLYKK